MQLLQYNANVQKNPCGENILLVNVIQPLAQRALLLT